MYAISNYLNTIVRLFKEEKSCTLQNGTVKPSSCRGSLLSTSLRREEKEDGLLCPFHSWRNRGTEQFQWFGQDHTVAVAQAEQVPSASICIPTPHRSDCWANTLIEILGQIEKTNKQKNHHHALLLVQAWDLIDTHAFWRSFPENLLL